jgi:hypothetical protein
MRTWARAAVLFGIGYSVTSVVLALPSTHAQLWRFAAWGAAGVLLSMHVAYERFRLGNAPLTAALHVGLGAAIGGFGIALTANVHSVLVAAPSRNLSLLRLSLVFWPVITALPAFLVALGMSAVLARRR